VNEVTFEPSPEGGNVTKMVIYLEKWFTGKNPMTQGGHLGFTRGPKRYE
jgi:hypothetical protein